MKTGSESPSSDIYYASGAAHPYVAIETVQSSGSGLLGASSNFGTSDSSDNTLYLTPTPFPPLPPVPTYAPAPTAAPVYTSTTTSTTTSTYSCIGDPTAFNSEAIVSSTTSQVGSSVTITIELFDCNNNFAPVNDSLTITLSNTDGSARINGSPAPITIQAQNGKATFTVLSSNAGTDTFVVTDTSRPFTVTDPHNKNPAVTFTNTSSGNANCTTSAGAPNTWYSDVYPNPPVSTSNGSVTLQVVIRDCNKNQTQVNDTLNVTLSSGDSGTQVNGSSLPYSTTAQNGQANLTVTSQVNGTVVLVVTDTTSGFTITDPNDHNPSISFTGSSSSTPTPAATDTPTPTLGATSTPTPSPSTAPTLTTTPSPSPAGSPNPSPT